ncbi:MmcQ/YjbR family DNA-binding protein [Cryptosporangium sp. NPDC048952]|uniref:MmcQ/YjbR family DNA-binding protein n=1 Tax=Cryptosporangium sp. NPDC048952 TaxID=3363961 RepID=UPI00371AF9F1
MATWDDVRRLALALPETAEGTSYGNLAWKVRGTTFVWNRPVHKGDAEPILGVHVADEGVKAALIADDPDVYFTIPHFDGYPSVLVRLERIGVDELEEAITEAWLLRAPKRLAAAFSAQAGSSTSPTRITPGDTTSA